MVAIEQRKKDLALSVCIVQSGHEHEFKRGLVEYHEGWEGCEVRQGHQRVLLWVKVGWQLVFCVGPYIYCEVLQGFLEVRRLIVNVNVEQGQVDLVHPICHCQLQTDISCFWSTVRCIDMNLVSLK